MSSESVRKSNSPNPLGEWLQENDLMPEYREKAVLWPKDHDYASSLSTDTRFSEVIATSNTDCSGAFQTSNNITEYNALSHDISKAFPGQVDLEYGWALGDDAAQRKRSEEMDSYEALNQIVETSDMMLRPGVVAVYNLEASTRDELDYNTGREFAEALQQTLEEELERDSSIHHDPEMRNTSIHVVWRKPTL